jgi:hypothetical protein
MAISGPLWITSAVNTIGNRGQDRRVLKLGILYEREQTTKERGIFWILELKPLHTIHDPIQRIPNKRKPLDPTFLALDMIP